MFFLKKRRFAFAVSTLKIQDGGRPPCWIFNLSNTEDNKYSDSKCNRMKVMLSFQNSRWKLDATLDVGMYSILATLSEIKF